MNALSDTITSTVKNWWWFIIKGLLLIVAGAAIFARPAEGYLGLSVLFSLVILGAGLTQIFFSIGNSDVMKGWGWTFASGVIDVIIGIYLLSYPVLTMASLPFILGFWLMIRAFYLMGASFDVKAMGIPGWGWILAGGFLLAILAFFVLYFPAAGAISIVAYSGTAFIVAGIFNIMLALRLKSVKQDVKGFESKIKHAAGLQ